MTLRSVRTASLLVALGLAACSAPVLVGEAETRDASLSTPPVASRDGGTIVCGSNVCAPTAPAEQLAEAPPCCYAATECGALLSSACIELNSAGVLDPRCPSFGSLPGCCKPDDTCGLMATGSAFGCVDPFAVFPGATTHGCTFADE
ncbi:MAG TPA: hypothetical protein VH142_04020 [Polyangiaceae bacterium]|jgi:hypothetical protein|nr:hypothetical protein [Polyangiaceae bacterium]